MTGIDDIEARHAMEGLAESAATFFKALRAQGFNRKEAFQLTQTWLIEIGRGAIRANSE